MPPGVEVYEINGPFFFGAAEKFKDTLSEVSKKPKVLIMRMRHVPAIDSTAMHALEGPGAAHPKGGTVVLLSDVHAQPRRAGAVRAAGGDRRGLSVRDIDEALRGREKHLGLPRRQSLPASPA